jgi:predicted chitinase
MKYYVISIRLLSQDTSKVRIGNYQYNFEGKDEYINDIFIDYIKKYYNTTIQSDLLSPLNDNSDDNQLNIEISFNSDINIDSTLVDLRSKMSVLLKDSFTSIDKIPSRVDYEIVKDESSSIINTYISSQNAGGWEIIYRIKSIPEESKPEQTLPIVSAPTQSQSIQDDTSPPISTDQNPVPQEVSKGDSGQSDKPKQKSGNFPGIKNIFGSTLKIDPINFKVPSSEKDKQEFIRGLGYLPFVWYNGYQINYTDIKYLSISHEGILPKCKLTFSDSMGLIKSNGFPLDDTKIEIFINPKSKNIKPIHIEFKVQNFQDVGGNSYTIGGIINIPEMYLKKYKSYSNKTSSEALQQICKESGIGFNSNVDNSSDSMTWINAGKKVYQMINDVVSNSYKSDTSFIVSYIDFDYCLNYIDLEKELTRDNKNDVGIDTGGLSFESNSTEEDRIIKLALSNDHSFRGSSMYFNKYKVKNNSTSISLKKGYTTKTIFDIDSITSDQSNVIVLKGAPSDTKFFNDNYSTVWTGKRDDDNSHQNYNYSIVQNRINIDDLVKVSVEMELPDPNFNLYIFQKINISFVHTNASITSGFTQERLNGSWLIININFIYDGKKLKQVVTAVKRELSAVKGESGTPPDKNKSGGETNDNKTDEVNQPTNTPSIPQNSTNPNPVLDPILSAMRYWDINNKFYKIAIVSNIKKESGLKIIPGEENLKGYANTSNDRIRSIFGNRVKSYNDSDLTTLKKDTPKFADVIYGPNSGMGLGNDEVGDGWKYRGRGYIQLTGKSLYKKFGDYASIDILNNPDILINDHDASAKVAVGYLKYHIKNEDFTDQDSADRAVTQAVGGSGLNLNSGYGAQLLAKVNSYSANPDSEIV